MLPNLQLVEHGEVDKHGEVDEEPTLVILDEAWKETTDINQSLREG